MSKKDVYRIVTHTVDGKLRIKDYHSREDLMRLHTQVGIDDCSTDLELRGMPVFRGLIGPMPEGKNIIRYESPQVFESLTKEWSAVAAKRRSRTRKPPELEAAANDQAHAHVPGPTPGQIQ